ncbi:MAG: glycosyltransferase, partial [Candidatus Limnocylindria bacterium]
VAPFVAAIDERRPQIGGAQAIVLDLARGLSARGHDVTLLAPHGSRVSGARLVDLGIEADPAAALRSGTAVAAPSQVAAFAAVGRWLGANPFDVVHGHAFDAPAFARVRGRRIVHTLHLPPLDGATVAAVGGANGTLATVSESCRAAWAAAGIRVPELLPNGLDVTAVPVGRGDSGRLAFAGRMSPEKGADVACRVASAIGAPLTLAGSVYDEAYFAREVEPLLGPDIVYAGPLERGALWRMLGAASATLLPVRWDEPFGMVALESLATGTPVVAYARGGLPEIVVDGRSGALVRADDEAGLAAAARGAASLRRADCRSDAGRHDLARMLDAHESLYRRLAASRPDG